MTENFTWMELWPEGATSQGWSHSGIAVDPAGGAWFAAPEGAALIVLDADGTFARRVPVTLVEIHGISVDPVQPEIMWLADPGEKPRPSQNYRVERSRGRAVALSDGRERDLVQPAHLAYESTPWRPTSIAAYETGVWVADGYGASLLHQFDRDGGHTLTLDGTATGVGFDCPHGILITVGDGQPRLTVADRGNRRLVHFDVEGNLLGVVADELFTTPSSLAARGADIVVTDLNGGLLAVDAHDRVRSLLPQRAPIERTGHWPNAVEHGRLVRPELEHAILNSPHGVAVASDGSILLTEWLIGGRQWRLVPS